MRKFSKREYQRARKLPDLDVDADMEQEEELFHYEKDHRKPIIIASMAGIAIAIVLSLFTGGFSSAANPEEVVANRVSASVSAGETLFDSEVNAGIDARDFEVTVNDNHGEARMLIWDFNSEDLDEVQILVNGQPVKEKLILTNRAAAISIPVPSTVTIKGLKDNGGGISYAAKFPNDKKTYFNTVTKGTSNTYTVKPL
ncbi:hypothetical protein D1B31_03620 [Neobacillus notoginsengisoli]|uniref:Uncharacterized protein n=1 Tax=Neobacillus notoginsengisoli TaxID=1578198 RepID=A0A417YY57_9BACI|nr:hypothetical protein [Neobacillus notoginsengisoli]RHW42689.1 hypothetical protein D1B31_03620 [Neobacillus notoginsengisoli]